MRIASVIGTVTLCRCHPSITGYRWIVAAPFGLDALRADRADGEEIVVLDELGVGMGSKIAVSEGSEAQMPFYPNKKPIDAYTAAALDAVSLDGPIVENLLKG
jgi:ethanolamine utilization protein EutN